MVMTVTLNPCIDYTLTVSAFTRGSMNRVAGSRQDIAGKGINVGVALTNLGCPCVCAGFNYNHNGQQMEAWLDERGVAHDFTAVEGSIRTNIKVFEQDTGIMTELNQPGAYVPPEVVEVLLAKIKAAGTDMLVLSGSRPQGVETDIYQRILEEYTGLAILDTEGEALLKGLNAKHPPFLIKPNLYELERAFGVRRPDRHDIVQICRKLIGNGLRAACVSLGGGGAVLVTESNAYYASALNVPVRGVQGAGDAMVAGIVYALAHNEPESEWLRYASAAASASVIKEGTQMCSMDDFNEMLGRVIVNPLMV